MALFGRKKASTPASAQSAKSAVARVDRDLSQVLLRPRVTEKSARLNEQNAYTFLVRKGATKYDVRDAVRQIFNVTPRKITIVNRTPRTTHLRSRSRTVTEPGMRKAHIFLKKGDRIDLA
ncbi:50S ribosomal protein L23 [Candidatus Kaiserbacteria bacterium]|nr:50S ribosomal protein L23 [Candidatus Kaiserbacteria bacterium]